MSSGYGSTYDAKLERIEEKEANMNSPVDEQKPCCPACKSINLMIETWSSGDCAVFDAAECMDCHTKVNDVRKWNTRAESPDSVDGELIENIEAKLNQLKALNFKNSLAEITLSEGLDQILKALQSRSTPPPVAGGEIERVIEGLKRLLKAVCDKDHSKWEKEAYLSIPAKKDDTDHILSDAIDLLAALQHQDCVVISRECAERSAGWANESKKKWGT